MIIIMQKGLKTPDPGAFYILQRGVQWKQGVVVYIIV